MLVLLDRDGVINHDIIPNGVTALPQLVIYPQALEAIGLLKKHHYQIAVITNQSAIGKGLLTIDGLHTIHAAIRQKCRENNGDIDAFYYCPDHPDRPTYRRKPHDGMLREALADFGAVAAHTPFIGDSIGDMQAAQRAGCPAYLVATGKGKDTYQRLDKHVNKPYYCANILDATHHIIAHYAT